MRFASLAAATIVTLALTAYFVGAYVGVGVDLQLGNAHADATLDGDLEGTDPSTGDPIDIGTAHITMDGDNGPAMLAYHILVGLEANVWRLEIFGQATLIPVDGASVAVGVRVRL